MIQNRRLLVSKCAVILGVIPVLIYAYDYGPDAGKSGVPGESLCTEVGCHVGTNVSVPGVPNSGPGSVSVRFPNGLTYTPGVKQHLTVTIADPNQREWGFQLTARPSGDSKTQAGTFQSTDTFTLVMCGSSDLFREQALNFGTNQTCPPALPLVYIEHSSDGALRKVPQSQTYEFDWTPPATNVGNITIYVAGNAANGDATSNGDRIYTNKYDLAPAAGGGPPPAIAQGGVVNNASNQPGIQPGSWVSIYGANLANTNPGRVWLIEDFVNGNLPTSLDGVSVTINGKPAYVYYVSPGQLNVLAPADNFQGDVPVVVTNNGSVSASATARLQPFSPAFFLWPGSYAVATRPDFSLAVKPGVFPGVNTVPAKPGDVIIFWGTGFGPTNPDVPSGVPVPFSDKPYAAANPPSITIGNANAQVLAAALTPGAAGLYQVVVQIPSTAPDGDLPVKVSVGGFQSPDGVTITVQH